MDDQQVERTARQLAPSTDRRNVVRGMIGTGLGALLLRFGLDPQSAAGSTTAGVAEAINAYRVSEGLAAIPVSDEMTRVSRAHVTDLNTYHPETTCNGNFHSWSSNGNWSGGCYDPNNGTTYPVMWNKPREITEYPGNGYEIAAMGYPDVDSALEGWKGSQGHNDVILNQGIWATHPWGALGGWFEGEFAVAWFGEEPGTPPVEEPPVTNPPGTRNPTFSGVKATITNAIDSPNTGNAKRVRDGQHGSNWSTAQNYPNAAALTVDLGMPTRLSGIKWLWTNTNYGDQFQVRVGNSTSGPWTTVGTFGNGTATYTWFGTPTNATGRFVQFSFTNPNRDLVMGALGEIEIWRAVTNPPGTKNPVFSGSKIKLTNAFDSPNTGTANRVRDGVTSSNWSSPQNRPNSAAITVDLGSSTQISGIRWLWTNINFGDQFDVRVANSINSPWTTIGRFGNGTATYTWFGTLTNTSGRFVQFLFSNPNRDLVLGALGEIEVWRPSSTVNPPGTLNPSVQGLSKRSITNVFDSPNSGTARRVIDGASWSNWAIQGSPNSATITLDMGNARSLTTIRWMMPNSGYADQFQVHVATSSNGPWSTLGTFGNPTSTNTWFGIELADARNARFAQFVFSNPNGDPAIGAFGEIELWGPQAAASARNDPQFVGEALPIVETAAEYGDAGLVDGDSMTNTFVAAADAATVTTATLDLAAPAGVTGVRWKTEGGDLVTIATSLDGMTWQALDPVLSISNGENWQGVSLPAGRTGGTVRVVVASTDGSTPAALSDLEVWGIGEDEVTPVASPEAPDASPVVTEESTEELTEEAPATPVATEEPTEETPATPVATEESTTEPSEEPTAESTEEPTVEATSEPSEEPTAEATEEPTAEPTAEVFATEEPIETPLPVVDTGDTEDSGTAWNTQDEDASTVWHVSPSKNPVQVRLYVDLGQVQPIDRISLTLGTWDQLPYFEIWLSENADTWFNVTPDGINGWSLPRDEVVTISLGYDARFIRIVIPNADASGLGQIGGIGSLNVWAGDIARTLVLANVFLPTTPTSVPVEPTEAVIPTEEPEIAEPTEEWVPTEEPSAEPTAEIIPTDEVLEEPTMVPEPEEVPPADDPDVDVRG